MRAGGARVRSDIPVTRVERIVATETYKRSEWFTASDMAQCTPISADDLRVIFAQRKDLFERREGHLGKPAMWRKRSAHYDLLTKPFRTEVGFGEEECTPKYC